MTGFKLSNYMLNSLRVTLFSMPGILFPEEPLQFGG